MSKDSFAEMYVFSCLARALKGLPVVVQSSLFDNLRAHIYGLAEQHQLGRCPDREEALRRAVNDVIGDPAERNREYRQSYRWDRLKELPANALTLLSQIWRRPAQRRTYRGPLSRRFGPETALHNDPDLLERLHKEFGDDYVRRISWPGTFAWPLDYLGCAVTDTYFVFSVGHEIWEDYGGSYHRHVTYYAFTEDEPTPRPVASCALCWTAEEGVVYPVSLEPQRIVGRHSQVAESLSSFPMNWLTTQCETVKLFTWDDQGEPLLVPVSDARCGGRYAKIWFDLPDVSERQLTWLILAAFVLVIWGLGWAMATFIPVSSAYAELPPPPPPSMDFDPTPLTRGEAFKINSILAAVALGLVAVVGGIVMGVYCGAREMARELLASTPLGVSKELRPVVFRRKGEDEADVDEVGDN